MNELKPLTRCCLCGNIVDPVDGRIVCCGISNPIPRKWRKIVQSMSPKQTNLKLDEINKALTAVKAEFANNLYSYWIIPEDER